MSFHKLRFLGLAAAFLAAFAVTTLYLTGNTANVVSPKNLVFFKEDENVTKNGSCNFFSGKWIYDNVSYPIYKEKDCVLMENFWTCEKNGRKDLEYQNWRWQPHQCDLPKFNGTALLEKLRNKKVVFVGDSLNRNQWASFLCLVYPYLPSKVGLEGNVLRVKIDVVAHRSINQEVDLFEKHVKEYNASISFHWSPYLVESNYDGAKYHKVNQDSMIVRFKSIEKHGRHWMDADILIFNTFAWWKFPQYTVLWGAFDSSDAIYKKFSMSARLYEVALNTWSDWLEFQVDRNKTKIFFTSASPFQLGSNPGTNNWSCYNAKEPIFDETYWPSGAKRSLMEIVESTIEKLEKRGVKVQYLNITQLSGYREDARPSIYRPYTEPSQKNQPEKYSDCLHWCLPGVPDIWNQILYAYIMES